MTVISLDHRRNNDGRVWVFCLVSHRIVSDRNFNFHDRARNRVYKLDSQTAKLFVRPRAWHLLEAHVIIDGEPATSCLVDSGLYFYHNHVNFCATQSAGYGPFFYLPKMEHSMEAKIGNCAFERAEKVAGLPRWSIRATVLIETLPAVFQMDEILYELRDHSVGLNCGTGRWDYIFSYVKTFQAHPDRLLPDRFQVGMAQHFMRSDSDLLIRTCHRRGVHAMGRMAAQIPIRDDPVANEAALELVRKDKLREVRACHDGSWQPTQASSLPSWKSSTTTWVTPLTKSKP